MSCADSISSSNPDGANVLSCEQNEEWAMKQSQSQQSKDRKVAQHMCDTCSFEDYCLPPLMRDHEGPLAEVGEDALDLPPGFEDDTTGSDMMGKDSASGKSPSHSYMGILAALVWVPIILFI